MTTKEELVRVLWNAYVQQPDTTFKATGVLRNQFYAMTDAAITEFKDKTGQDLPTLLWGAAMDVTPSEERRVGEKGSYPKDMQTLMERLSQAAMEFLLLIPRDRL